MEQRENYGEIDEQWGRIWVAEACKLQSELFRTRQQNEKEVELNEQAEVAQRLFEEPRELSDTLKRNRTIGCVLVIYIIIISAVLMFKVIAERNCSDKSAKIRQVNERLRAEIESLPDWIPEKLSDYRRSFHDEVIGLAEGLPEMIEDKLLAYRQWVHDELLENHVSLRQYNEEMKVLNEEVSKKDAVIVDLEAKLSACDGLTDEDSLLHATPENTSNETMYQNSTNGTRVFPSYLLSESNCFEFGILSDSLLGVVVIAFVWYKLRKVFGCIISGIEYLMRTKKENPAKTEEKGENLVRNIERKRWRRGSVGRLLSNVSVIR